jgi:hypothetical protein
LKPTAKAMGLAADASLAADSALPLKTFYALTAAADRVTGQQTNMFEADCLFFGSFGLECLLVGCLFVLISDV